MHKKKVARAMPSLEAVTTITSAINKDHRELVQYYKNIISAPDIDTATRWQNQFTCALSRHLAAEELVVYPVFEKRLSDRWTTISNRDQIAHRTIQEKVNDLQNMDVETPDFFSSLESLINDLAQYFSEVEMADLPALDRVLTRKESESLADSFIRSKTFVSSRSHPLLLNIQSFAGIPTWISAPVDYVSNMFRKFPHESALRDNAGAIN